MKKSFTGGLVNLDLSKLKPRPTITPPKIPCLVLYVNNLISQGNLEKAISSLYLLWSHRLTLKSATILSLINLCADARSPRYGKILLNYMKAAHICTEENQFWAKHLIRMFLRCGCYHKARTIFDAVPNPKCWVYGIMISFYIKERMIDAARLLFDQMPKKDLNAWNMMIYANAMHGACHEALGLFLKMRQTHDYINFYTVSGVSIACMKLMDVGFTRQFHCQLIIFGFNGYINVLRSVLNAYKKSHDMISASKLFDELRGSGIYPWIVLISGYALWGDMVSAQTLFNQMPDKEDSVAWTSMISGYARNGMGDAALRLFSQMMIQGIEANPYTFSSALCACATMTSLKHGKQIHAVLVRTIIFPNSIVVSCLIDMYSKCGCLRHGRLVFNLMNRITIVVCNTMLSALVRHGCGEEAVKMFSEILVSKFTMPNSISFRIILNACCDFGFVKEGLRFFEAMKRYQIVPHQEHIACLTNLSGRASLSLRDDEFDSPQQNDDECK